MKKYTWITLIAGSFFLSSFADVTVTSLTVTQRPGTKLIDITYDISSTTTNAMTVTLTVNNGTNTINTTKLTGDIGSSVTNGAGKSAVWDMGQDWNGNVATLNFSITADDGRDIYIVTKTGQTTSYYTGDDGNLKTGLAWPTPRFTDQGDGTVVDNLTGLEWVKAPHSLSGNSSTKSWTNAVNFCNGLVYSGHSDWRLPNIKELVSLVDSGCYSPALSAGHPFSGIKNLNSYFSSTTSDYYTNYVWILNMGDGAVSQDHKTTDYVWPVRNGQKATPSPTPKTGQMISYLEGDDGDLKTGVTWPNPRFTDHGDGTVTDNLTGLEWVKAPHSLSGNSGTMTWSSAIDFCNRRTYAGYSDWRLPSRNELMSLIDCGHHSPTLPDGNPFSGVQIDDNYWSSTSYQGYTDSAWYVNMGYDDMSRTSHKLNGYWYVWPVRGEIAPISSPVTYSKVIGVDARDYILTVTSEHGTSIPSTGTNFYAWRSTVTGSVQNTVTSGLTNWSSAGWSGSGSVPASGASTNTGSMVLTDLVSSIAWNWDTNYWLAINTDGNGSASTSGGWVLSGTNVQITATPDTYYHFAGWSGDVVTNSTTFTIMMSRPRLVTASFSANITTNTGTPEWWMAQYGLTNFNIDVTNDLDRDGLSTWQEYIAGCDPTNRASVLDVGLSIGVSGNEISWYGVSGRYYQLEYTDNLREGWMPKGAIIQGANALIIDSDVSSVAGRFYRIRVSENASGFN